MKEELFVKVFNNFKEETNRDLNIKHSSGSQTTIKPKKWSDPYSLEGQKITIKVNPGGGISKHCYIGLPGTADLIFISKGAVNMTFSRTAEGIPYFEIPPGQPLDWQLIIVKPAGTSPAGFPQDTVSIGDDPPGVPD